MESNDYLNQVVQEQARVEGELRQRRQAPAMAGLLARDLPVTAKPSSGEINIAEGSPGGTAIDYRITGWWRWKTVVVPPNVYVVHTRRGHTEPLHLGLGVSFGYNPYTDSFLVIPAAVQTLLINARCISAERQGVLVQAYVQWVVDDVRTAYRKLDFSDSSDPMRIVNIQLREQAEAAIKDKVAMMPIDAILSDKQPIIEELTHRLRSVAESSGEGAGSSGLGLKIVTVQIKEAVVSSTRLWENLQKPFRADREKLARLAELQSQQEISTRELANRQARETGEIEANRRLAELRAEQEREAYTRDQAEKARRHKLEQEAEQHALAECAATEKARRLTDEELALQEHELTARRIARQLEAGERELALEKARAELEQFRSARTIERDDLEHKARTCREEREVEVFHKRRAVENELSEAHVKAQLIARLPEVAAAMPKPEELRAISVGGDGATSLTGLVAQLMQVVEGALTQAGHNGK
jgi:hypothetical protein